MWLTMNNDIKIRALLKDKTTELKMIIIHPMDTGRRKNDAGEIIPAHFIELLTVKLNDIVILEAQWGTGIAKNPYLTFNLNNAKIGDKISVYWKDNLGETGFGESSIVQG